MRGTRDEKVVNAGELITNFISAKKALWDYFADDETGALPHEVYDFRDYPWTGIPTSEGLCWGWNGERDTWQHVNAQVSCVVVRDGLTFIWYSIKEGETRWGVFDNSKSGQAHE